MRRPFKPYPIEAPVETGICQELCPCCSNQTLAFRKSYREATTAPYGQSLQTSYPLRMVTDPANIGLLWPVVGVNDEPPFIELGALTWGAAYVVNR